MNTKPVIAIAALILAAGAGLYVIFGGPGNTDPVVNADLVSAKLKNCELSLQQGEKLATTATGEVAAFRALNEPLDLNPISFKDRDGTLMSIADWNGKTIVFNLWATWCPPCREEMPWFETLQTEKGNEKFQVVPVSIDFGAPEKPLKFYEETGLKELPFLHDGTTDAFQFLKKRAVALGMPVTLLVDPQGCGLGVLNGPAHWASPDAYELVEAALDLSVND